MSGNYIYIKKKNYFNLDWDVYVLMVVWSRTCWSLTRVSMVLDHAAVVGIHPFLANSLQAKFDSAADRQVWHSQFQIRFFVPNGLFVDDVVCSVEIECSQEEVRVVTRVAPSQRHTAAVPWCHNKVLGDFRVWWWTEKLYALHIFDWAQKK